MYELLIDYFEIPHETAGFIDLFLRPEEVRAVEAMGRAIYSRGELSAMLSQVSEDPGGFIDSAYSRAVFNKVQDSPEISYKAANFYKRLAVFAQYEPEKWQSIPASDRGKCADICNFGAFRKEARGVSFDGDACWGCTICGNYCPVGAITLIPRQETGVNAL